MSRGEAVAEVAFGLVGQVVEFLGIALRIVGEQAFAPKTLAPLRSISHFAADGYAQTADIEIIGSPCLRPEDVRIVVIAVFVADFGCVRMTVAIVIVEVVLICDGVRTEVALGEFVDVGPIVAAKQVFDLRIVLRTVPAQRKASVDFGVIAEDMREVGNQIPVQLIGVTLFDHIVRTTARTVLRLIDRIVLDIVRLIHLIPVEMADILVVGLPVNLLPSRTQHILVEREVARQITVIVRARVGTILPRQRRVTVHAEAQRGGQIEFRTV